MLSLSYQFRNGESPARLKGRAFKGGKSGPAIFPGDPEKSLLIQAITVRHERLKMPPTEPLKEAEIVTLAEWVKAGVIGSMLRGKAIRLPSGSSSHRPLSNAFPLLYF